MRHDFGVLNLLVVSYITPGRIKYIRRPSVRMNTTVYCVYPYGGNNLDRAISDHKCRGELNAIINLLYARRYVAVEGMAELEISTLLTTGSKSTFASLDL